MFLQLSVKLFCIFAFERDTCCIQIEDDGLIKFGCIGYTLGVLFFLNRYSCFTIFLLRSNI